MKTKLPPIVTLPTLCRVRGYSLDGMRFFIRGRPELRALGTMIGPARAYSADEAKRICNAWETRETARKGLFVK